MRRAVRVRIRRAVRIALWGIVGLVLIGCGLVLFVAYAVITFPECRS